MEPLDQLRDGSVVTFDMRFHRAVRAVPDPAGHAKLPGAFAGPLAEEDTLHPAGHSDVAGDGGHHTVAMSGASSAFMPTTL